MIRVGLLSDTHSFLDKKIFHYFNLCDEIWHAGDIGSVDILEQLEAFRKTRSVYGNIDGREIKYSTSEFKLFEIESHKVLLTHIAGKFGGYNLQVRELIKKENPTILVCGHSHILKVAFDQKYGLLYLNPGACGKTGFHSVRTLIRFVIDKKEIKDLEVIELKESK